MRIALILIIILLLCNVAYADKLGIPFDCYPKAIQEAFAEEGLKVDFRAEDRTKDSWGFIQSEGSRYYIYTYHPIPRELQQEIFPILTKIILRSQDG